MKLRFIAYFPMLFLMQGQCKYQTSDEWHGTLILALITDTDAVLAADSLEVRNHNGTPEKRHSCKVFALGKGTAATIGGVSMPEVMKQLATRNADGGLAAKEVSHQWYELAKQHLTDINYQPRVDEFKTGSGGGLFVTASEQLPKRYAQLAIAPVRTDGGVDYRAAEGRPWQHGKHLIENNEGTGVAALTEWSQGKTQVGRKDKAFVESLGISSFDGHQLDEAVIRIMKGAIDADVQFNVQHPDVPISIDNPVEILHLNLKTGKMYWVMNTLCPADLPD